MVAANILNKHSRTAHKECSAACGSDELLTTHHLKTYDVWQAIENVVMNFWGPLNEGNFLTRWGTVSSSGRTLLCVVSYCQGCVVLWCFKIIIIIITQSCNSTILSLQYYLLPSSPQRKLFKTLHKQTIFPTLSYAVHFDQSPSNPVVSSIGSINCE